MVKKDAINRLKLIENVHYQQIPDFVIQPDGSVKAVPNPQHPCFLLTPVTCFKRMIKFFSFVEGLHYTRENKEKGTKNGWIVCEETEKEFEKIGLIEGFNYKKINSGYDFIHVKEGVSPTLLKNLLATRKQVRKEGEKATGLLAAIIDALQNAFKAMANSWYGGTGTGERGYLPLREIAETVTRYGRCYIMMTKWFIETNFNSSKGFPFDTEGIYGDTDSVFVKFKLCKEPLLKPEGQEWVCENTTGKGMSKITSRYDLEYIQKVSLQMADQVTKYIDLDPMSLAYEKSFNGILLVSKKRYAGFKIVWDGGKVKWGDTKFSATGLECVRRDACSIVGEMVETVLKKVILERNVRGAVTYVRGEIEKLYQGKMPYSKLIITKSLSRKPEDYKTKSAHVVLAQRIAERTPEKAYKLGDRVKYVMIPGTHNQKAYELGEDPIYAFENGIGLDYKWYMENQIKRPLQRIFFYVFKNRQVLRELAETEPDAMWVQQSFGNVKEEDLIDSDEEAEDREEQEAMKREYEETEDDYMYEDLDQSEEEGSSPGIKREREESEEESQEEPEPKKQKIENKDRGTLAGFFGIKKSNNEPMKAKRLTLKEKKKQQEKLVKEQQKEIDKGIANSIIFDGPHTRKIVKSAGAEGKGLFQFIKKTTKCFVCKVPTGSTKKPLCGSCLKDGKKDATLEACRKRCDEAQKDFDKSMKICIDCVKQNPSFKIDACRNVDCNNLWDRLTAERCLKTEKDNLSLDW